MIASVRKFQVEYKGIWLQVFCIFEPPSDIDGTSISYCVPDKTGKPVLVGTADITGIRSELD